ALLLESPFMPQSSWRVDDGVTLAQNGRFRLEGRLDRIIKLEGKRLALPEMEQRLEAHPWVECAVAVPLPGASRLGVVAVLTSAGRGALKIDGARNTRQMLRDYLRQVFEPVLLPRRLRFVSELPISDRGKIQHRSLQSLLESPDEADA
ncbi:MAG: hypothetical protein RQ736_15200, partial [Thiogranum sp.]|nr:hypothetical protein [Thiogranum sp.]